MTANQFQNTSGYGLGDIYLSNFADGTGFGSGPSFKNHVITTYCTKVLNLGTNNNLIGYLDISTNSNNPPNGMCQIVLPLIFIADIR